MATATIPQTAKGAVKHGKGKVYSRWLSHEGNKSIPLAVIQKSQQQLGELAQTTRFTLENLLPVEESQRSNLQSRVNDIERLLRATKPRLHKYPLFSTEPLTWRDKNGYPRLVIMALDLLDSLTIRVERGYDNNWKWQYLPLSNDDRYKGVLRDVVDQCYRDVVDKLYNRCPTRGEMTIGMKLGSLLIPPGTRQKIADARHFFGDQLFLIVEATKWEENKVVYPDPDPLIVGYQDGLLFLVDAFDLTPIEQMAAVEFTVSQENLGL